jgi:SAM-dependent methyltransferase
LRTLDRDIPELKEYLKSGAKVLDIGCGPGTITLDVASVVYPGEVIGIDPFEYRIQEARDWVAEVTPDANISFEVGDSHKLDFPDDSFDVVYSHTVLHFLLDPVSALKEQKRVVKKGGWVIASGVRDSWASPRHPPCPHWFKVWQALDRYQQSVLREFQLSGVDPVAYINRQRKSNPSGMLYYDLRAGRKCFDWFSSAGLDDLQITVKAERMQYPGSEHMEHHFAWDLILLYEPESGFEEQVALWAERMIAEGLLDEETLERAKEEARAWYQDPSAFNYWTLIFAAGRA